MLFCLPCLCGAASVGEPPRLHFGTAIRVAITSLLSRNAAQNGVYVCIACPEKQLNGLWGRTGACTTLYQRASIGAAAGNNGRGAHFYARYRGRGQRRDRTSGFVCLRLLTFPQLSLLPRRALIVSHAGEKRV